MITTYQKILIKTTRNPEYLPDYLKIVYDCVEKGLETSTDIAELNPLNVEHKRNVSWYGKLLSELFTFNMLTREKIQLDHKYAYGYQFKYKTIKREPIKLKDNQYLV